MTCEHGYTEDALPIPYVTDDHRSPPTHLLTTAAGETSSSHPHPLPGAVGHCSATAGGAVGSHPSSECRLSTRLAGTSLAPEATTGGSVGIDFGGGCLEGALA